MGTPLRVDRIEPWLATATPHAHAARPDLAVHRSTLLPVRVDTLEASHLRCLDEPFEGTARCRSREITVHGSSLFAGDRQREEETAGRSATRITNSTSTVVTARLVVNPIS